MNNYLHGITGTPGTHQVLFNPLFKEYKIASTNGSFHSGRNSTWIRVYIGSEGDCKNYINNKNL